MGRLFFPGSEWVHALLQLARTARDRLDVAVEQRRYLYEGDAIEVLTVVNCIDRQLLHYSIPLHLAKELLEAATLLEVEVYRRFKRSHGGCTASFFVHSGFRGGSLYSDTLPSCREPAALRRVDLYHEQLSRYIVYHMLRLRVESVWVDATISSMLAHLQTRIKYDYDEGLSKVVHIWGDEAARHLRLDIQGRDSPLSQPFGRIRSTRSHTEKGDNTGPSTCSFCGA